jgi:hypothetical protein
MAVAEHLKKDLERHEKKSKESKSRKEGSKESRTGKKHHFNVKQLDDGSFHVEHREQGENDSDSGIYTDGETSAHKNINSVTKHMKDCCGGAGEENEKEEGKEY